MQMAEQQRVKLPTRQQVLHLWLDTLCPLYPTWCLSELKPLARYALKDFYRFADTQEHTSDLRPLFDTKVNHKYSLLTEVLRICITLRIALRNSLSGFDVSVIILVLESFDVWQETVISTCVLTLTEEHHRRQIRIERELTQLSKLNECICTLNTVLDSISLPNTIAQLAHTLTDADLCVVFQSEGETLHTRASAGCVPYEQHTVDALSTDLLKTLVLDEQKQDIPVELARAGFHVDELQAMICTPLYYAGNKLFGKLATIYLQPQQFTSYKIKLQEVFAHQAGQSIYNARLLEGLSEQTSIQERERIARELHDTLFQSIASLNINLKVALQHIQQGDWDQVKRRVEEARDLGKSAIVKGRESLWNLHTNCNTCKSLLDTLQPELALFTEQTGIEPDLIVEGSDLTHVPHTFMHHLQRLVGEALNNIFRHAQATEVTVRVQMADKALQIEVQDNGVGFEPGAVDERHSFGLIGMHERANIIDADMQVDSAPGQGTRVSIHAPLQCKDSGQNTHHAQQQLG